VAVPLRLTAPLNGVSFVAPGKRSVYGILDCRLALILDDASRVLRAHDVAAVLVDNMYRPRARLPRQAKKRRPKSQHAYGLAIDILGLKLSDGRTLNVEGDWHGVIGAAPCGPDARVASPSEAAVTLRNALCALAREGLFNHVLTPNYDEAHGDHFHLDVKRNARERIVR
jgi:hypothetical protein